MDAFLVALKSVLTDSGFMAFYSGQCHYDPGWVHPALPGHRQGL